MYLLLLLATIVYLIIAQMQQERPTVVGNTSTNHQNSPKRELAFTIDKTWNGVPVLHNETVNIFLSGDETSKDVTMRIDAPFYDDPPPNGTAGEPFMNLWDYEVVEAFFLNEKDEYLEVEVGPRGQHIVLLLSGQRNSIKHSLPMNVTTEIKGSRWIGTALISNQYFPPQVTKLNAYSINGVGDGRRYLSLYPTEDGSTAQPDFHNLDFFRPIQMEQINSFFGSNTEYSAVWTSAMNK